MTDETRWRVARLTATYKMKLHPPIRRIVVFVVLLVAGWPILRVFFAKAGNHNCWHNGI